MNSRTSLKDVKKKRSAAYRSTVLFPLIFVAVLSCSGLRNEIVLDAMTNVGQENLQASALDKLPDGLHVVLCGAGSPLPDPLRSGPCTAVIAGDQLFIVDAGAGASRNLAFFQLPLGRIDAVLLTHFHSDHIDGLGGLMLQHWVNGAKSSPLPVYGPTGVEAVVSGVNSAYELDHRYRVLHHLAETIPPEGAGGAAMAFSAPTGSVPVEVLRTSDLTITSFEVDHSPVAPAVGYRFDYKGRSIVVSGDTKKSGNVLEFATGVDLLVHEALNREMVTALQAAAEAADRPRIAKIMHDILDYHTSPTEAAEIARDAGVGHLLFTHIVPPLPYGVMEATFTNGVDDIYDGPYTVGRDGVMVSLPAFGTDIEVEQLDNFME